VLDGFNHKGLGIEVDVSLPLEHVTRMLRTELSNGVANPGRFVVITDQKISVPTYVVWAETRGIQLDYIQPGKPQQNKIPTWNATTELFGMNGWR